jgi:hypothetical protein
MPVEKEILNDRKIDIKNILDNVKTLNREGNLKR